MGQGPAAEDTTQPRPAPGERFGLGWLRPAPGTRLAQSSAPRLPSSPSCAPARRKREVHAQPQARHADFSWQAGPMAHHDTKFVPACLSPAWPYSRGLGISAAGLGGAAGSPPDARDLPGLSTCWRMTAQDSARSVLAPLAARNTARRCLKAGGDF